MDNLPKDPPQPFGSNFNPHTNPVDPNNPYQTQPQPNPVPPPSQTSSSNVPENPDVVKHEHYSEAAQHKPRDEHGHFIHTNPVPQTPPNSPNPPDTPDFPARPQRQVTQNNPKDDEPLFEAKVNNPFSKFFNWIKRLIKSEGINIKIKPLTAISIAIALTGGGGIIGGFVGYAFPHNSPILHREVIYQGNLQKTEKGFFLTLPNSDLYTLRPKVSSSINFQALQSGQALVKGNLTAESFVIEVSEIIPLTPQSPPNPPNIPNLPNTP